MSSICSSRYIRDGLTDEGTEEDLMIASGRGINRFPHAHLTSPSSP
jgi:hypothetical protein